MSKIIMYADQRAVNFKKAMDVSKIAYTMERVQDKYDDPIIFFHVENYHIDRAVELKKRAIGEMLC